MGDLGFFVSVAENNITPEERSALEKAHQLVKSSTPDKDNLVYIRCPNIGSAVVTSESFRLEGVEADFLKGRITRGGMKEFPLTEEEKVEGGYFLYEARDILTDPWYGH